MKEKKINLSNLRDWQKEYITNKKRFNVLVVHRRAWKTVWAILDELIVAIKEKWDYWYVAPTYRQAKKIAWRMIQKFWDQISGFKYNASELIVTYENWSTISLFGAENPDSLRWLDLRWVIFDEYAQQPSNIYSEIVFPMINANWWWVTWIWTPKGKNAFYQLYQRALKDERFYTMLLRHTDTKLLTDEQIEDAKKEMTEEEFEQEYNCSWEAYMRWSVYWKELSLAHAEWRVKEWLYDQSLEVYTFWDLWVSDAMSIWFVQIAGWQIRIIDRYSNSWYGLEHYAEIIKSKPYRYKNHYFPHDIRQREISTWLTRMETAIKLLWEICKIVPMSTIESGIDAGRLLFKNIWIDSSLEEFINNLSLYQYEWDDKLGQFKKQPIHDFTSHDADWFRYMAIIFNHLTKKPEEEQKPKYDHPIDEIIFKDDEVSDIDLDFWVY